MRQTPIPFRKWLPWLLLALACIATAAVYWPGVTGGWVFDDYPNIVDNAAIHITWGHSTLGAWVDAALSSPASFLHRPLASLTFALNWMMGNGNPMPFKVTNIVIHVINGVLLVCMLRALLRLLGLHGARDPLAAGKGNAGFDEAAATRLALIVSAAWMLLPINLMAVLYVVQRMESLCQVFVLAGLWAYLHGRWMMLTATDAQRDRRGLLLAAVGIVLGTALGLTSKETAVLLPVFAFLAEWLVIGFARIPHPSGTPSLVIPGLPEGQNPGSVVSSAGDDEATDSGSPLRGVRNDNQGVFGSAGDDNDATLRAATPSFVIPGLPAGQNPESRSSHDKRIWVLFTVTLFIPAVLGFLWQLRATLSPAAYSGRDFTLTQRLLTEPRVLVDYLNWTIFPNPEVLSLYHDEIVKSTGLLAPWSTLGAMIVLVALIAVAVWLRKRRPLVALGVGWFFGAQLLTATIIPLELVYEQRMYFASIGVLLASGSLLLGLRWRVNWGLLRGTVAALALLWFGTVTSLRASEWSGTLKLALIEAHRHPESPRAVYEGGRQLLIAANYQPGAMLEQSRKLFEQASAIPGSSTLPDQALIMLVDHEHHGDDAAYWQSMARKLRDQPTRQEDISALISLTNCYGKGVCVFDLANLNRAYQAVLSRPYPIARLYGAYADFQRDLLHDDVQAIKYLVLAVQGAPAEPAYRIDLAALYARHGEAGKALQQIDALRRLDYGGRLDRQIAVLERLVEQGRAASPQ